LLSLRIFLLSLRIFLLSLRIFLLSLRIFLLSLRIFLLSLRIFLLSLRCKARQKLAALGRPVPVHHAAVQGMRRRREDWAHVP